MSDLGPCGCEESLALRERVAELERALADAIEVERRRHDRLRAFLRAYFARRRASSDQSSRLLEEAFTRECALRDIVEQADARAAELEQRAADDVRTVLCNAHAFFREKAERLTAEIDRYLGQLKAAHEERDLYRAQAATFAEALVLDGSEHVVNAVLTAQDGAGT